VGVVTQALELIIGKRSIDMNKQTRNFMLILMIVLLLAACGGMETPPAPEVEVTEEPISMPVPIVVSEPVGGIPAAGLAGEQEFSKYIGLAYPPSPEGLTDVFSMIIQDSDVYSLSLVGDGSNKMLWLSKITHYDTNGSAYWEVKDVLELSDLEAGLTLFPDGCLLNGVPESEIFVVGRNGVVVLAWRANISLDRFEVIAADGIQCSSDKAVNIP
jgi:hypothetical protein